MLWDDTWAFCRQSMGSFEGVGVEDFGISIGLGLGAILLVGGCCGRGLRDFHPGSE
jgi:hypothetical protein